MTSAEVAAPLGEPPPATVEIVFCALANGLPQTLIIITTTTQISRWAAFMMSFSGSISHFAERLFRFRREAGVSSLFWAARKRATVTFCCLNHLPNCALLYSGEGKPLRTNPAIAVPTMAPAPRRTSFSLQRKASCRQVPPEPHTCPAILD